MYRGDTAAARIFSWQFDRQWDFPGRSEGLRHSFRLPDVHSVALSTDCQCRRNRKRPKPFEQTYLRLWQSKIRHRSYRLPRSGGANADWDLISAYWARYFSLAESERKQFDLGQQNWLESLNPICRLNSQQVTFSSIQQQCVLRAYKKRAAGYRTQLSGNALVESRLSPEQHVKIQQRLIALGLLNDIADGQFGPLTRTAIEVFQAQSGFTESAFLTAEQRQQLLQEKASTKTATRDSDAEISDRAGRLSPIDAATQCESPDTQARLVGCTAIINAKKRGESSSVSLHDALDGRCWAYNDLEQYERALADCRAAIDLAPRYPYAYNNLGTALLGSGDVANAITAYTKSIELKPNFVYSYLGRAKAYIEVGKTEMAKRDFQYVLSIDPTNQNATDGIAAIDNAAPGESSGSKPLISKPMKDTQRLREARAFLTDCTQFVREQNSDSVPSIPVIAVEAGALQSALDKFDEPGAIRSMQKLADLLKPIAGFQDFERQQQEARKQQDARQLADAANEGNKNVFFIDRYMKDHLGDPKTSSLIGLRDQISGSLKKNTIEEIIKANDAILSYINQTGLLDSYEAVSKEFSNPPPPHGPGGDETLEKRFGIGEKSKFVVEGPLDEIVLLYNISSSAPNVWRNVRGDIVFQNDAASLCFAQEKSEITLVRYIEHKLIDEGAKKLTSQAIACDLTHAAATIDVIAFQRGELLKRREDYILALVKMIEGDVFRKYQIITDYGTVAEARQTFSLQLERDIENNQRKGFGTIEVNELSVACVIAPQANERVDGIKELLRRNRDVVAPKLTSDWKFVGHQPRPRIFGSPETPMRICRG